MLRLPLTHMILGLLLDAPAHGYELRRCLAPFLGAHGPLNAGLFYPALAKLERRGFVTKRRMAQQGAPDRQVYSVTGEGKRELMAWLTHRPADADVPRYDFFHRDPLLARVMFFHHLSPSQRAALLDAELATARTRLDAYREVRAGMRRRGADPFRIRILEFGLGYHVLRARWIRALLAAASSTGTTRRRDAQRTPSGTRRPGSTRAAARSGHRVSSD